MPNNVRNWTALLPVVIVVSGCQSARHVVDQFRPRPPLKKPLAVVADQPSPAATDALRLLDEAADLHDDQLEVVQFIEAPEPSPFPSELPVDQAALDVGNGGISAWTLGNLESLAIQHNPAIREQSASAYKAMGFREQVGTKPNPTVGYSGNQFADAGTDQHVVFVEQQFVLGGKLARNQIVLNQEVQSQLWEVEAQRYRVLTDVRQRYFEALAAQRRLELTEGFVEVAQKGVEIAQARLNAQEGSRPDVLQAEIQLQQIEVQRKRNEAALLGAWKQLMAVVGLPGTSIGRLEGDLPETVELMQWENVLGSILAASPELQAARARVSRAQANLERQRVQAIPNLSVMVAAGRDNGTDSGMINAQVGLPVPLFNKNEGNISAAEAELCRASQEVRRIEMAIESRLAAASRNYDAAVASVNIYAQEILPRAAETLQLAEQAYSVGEFDFLQILIARRTYFDANLEYVSAQAELAQANALVQGQVLSGSLETNRNTDLDSGLRDQTLGGE